MLYEYGFALTSHKSQGSVLILVLLENALRAEDGFYYEIVLKEVLILVLLENALREGIENKRIPNAPVLILVLLENALRGLGWEITSS